MAFNDAMKNDPADTDPMDQIDELKEQLLESYQRFERLRKYTTHTVKCAFRNGGSVCSCGLSELLHR